MDTTDDTFFGRDFARRMWKVKQLELEDMMDTTDRQKRARKRARDHTHAVMIQSRTIKRFPCYRAECSCGYVGPDYYDRHYAGVDSQEHVEQIMAIGEDI